MKKNVLLFALIVSLSSSMLVGCGGGGGGGGSNGGGSAPSGGAPTPPPPALSAADKILLNAGVPQIAWAQLKMINADYAIGSDNLLHRPLLGAGIPIAYSEQVCGSNGATHKEITAQQYASTKEVGLQPAYDGSAAEQPYFEHAVATTSLGSGAYMGVARESKMIDGGDSAASNIPYVQGGVISRSQGVQSNTPNDTSSPLYPIESINSKDAIWVQAAGNDGTALCDYSPTFCTVQNPGSVVEISPPFIDPNTANNYILVGEVNVQDPGTYAAGNYPGDNATLQATWIVAPGVNVTVADEASGSYKTGSGTSFATPMVSGAIAVIREAYPTLNAQQTRKIILDSANQTFSNQYQLNNCGANGTTNCGRYYFGMGLLDIKAALLLADKVVNHGATP
ncbi:MAG: S8 family serine peptidase [Halothiobacillus sp.]|nr:S8 family serine peptidase [Halothiobacillus sp.]